MLTSSLGYLCLRVTGQQRLEVPVEVMSGCTSSGGVTAQGRVHVAFEALQGGRPHKFSGQTAPVLSHLHGKEVLPHVQMDPLVF